MEAAGDVGGADDLQEGGVVAHLPAAESLSEIGDEVDVAAHADLAPLLKRWEVVADSLSAAHPACKQCAKGLPYCLS